tara:strand:+ start:1900 stop:2364 length:465 start_codon:yes stop_codon:yes gene_type:complete
MQKNIIFIIVFFIFSSCGYNSLYKNSNTKNFKFNFELIQTSGDKYINNNITSVLKNYSDKNLKDIVKIKLNSSYSKSSISRDKKGKTSKFNIVVTTEFNLINNDKEVKKITITEEIAIKNTSDSFQQKNYELKIKKDLSRSIARQFVEKLTSYK